MAALIALSASPDRSLRPTRVVILAYFAGMFISSGGLFTAYLGIYHLPPAVFGISGPALTALGIVGFFSGFIVIGLGVYVWSRPHHHRAAGAIILGLSILSLTTSFYGFFIGAFVLGLIAGALVLQASGRETQQSGTVSPAPGVETSARPRPQMIEGLSQRPVHAPASSSDTKVRARLRPQIAVFFVLGDLYVILGVLTWISTGAADAIVVTVVGGLVILIGVGFYLGFYHFFPGSAA